VFSATAPRAYLCILEHERDDPVEEFPLFLLGVLIKCVQLGHAVRRAQVFGAQDHDDQIGVAQRFHERGNQVTWAQLVLVVDHFPMLLFQRLTQPFDHFLALAIFFRGVG
jgi:hypothetical protein